MKVFFGLLSTLYNMYGFVRFNIHTVVYRKTSNSPCLSRANTCLL